MPPMDEFREETENMLKNATPWQKFKYYLYYYKWHALAIIATLIIAFTWIRDVVTSKDPALYVALVNGAALETAERFDLAYAAYAGIDPKEYDIIFDTSMQLESGSLDQMGVASSQKLLAFVSAGEIDVFEANEALFVDYANSTFFSDLRDILSEEQFAKCEPYLYYVDQKVIEVLDEMDPSFDEDRGIDIPDPTKPELMEDPIPVGLFVNDLTELTDYYFLGQDDAVLGIPVNAKNIDNAVKFIEFITR